MNIYGKKVREKQRKKEKAQGTRRKCGKANMAEGKK